MSANLQEIIPTKQPPVPGQLVTVRNRRFVVTAVAGSNTSEESAATQNLVTLSSVEDDALGEELQVVWEIEPGAGILERASMPEFTGFDEPARLDAFLNAVRWRDFPGGFHGAAGAVSQRRGHRGLSARPASARHSDAAREPADRGRRGLGKTIEAGLVVQEMLLRHRARSVLVVCPSSIQIQWRDQMRDKFGLEFRIVDSNLSATAASTATGSATPRCSSIISSAGVIASTRKGLSSASPAIWKAIWSF